MKRVPVAASAVLMLMGASSATAVGVWDGSRPELTRTGGARWNFEALLRDRFGSGPVCVVSKAGRPDFVSKLCGSLSLAQQQLYDFTFAGASHLVYHLVSRRTPPFSGNYPVAVEVDGLFVVCDQKARTFLFTNGAAYGFTPECLAPQPPP